MRQAPIDYIERTRAQYDALGFPPYAWIDQRDEPPPFEPISKPLSEMRVALIASGGIYQRGQIAFHHRFQIQNFHLKIVDHKGQYKSWEFFQRFSDLCSENLFFPEIFS